MALVSMAGGMTTKGLTAAFGTPSAGGPTGTGPSKGPAEAAAPPTDAAASKKAPLSADQRRNTLKELANKLKSNPDRVEVLGQLTDKAAELVEGVDDPATAMLEDLKYVIVGEGLTSRGTGSNYAGPFPGLGGFDPSFNDANARGDQMSHALAGIYIGHNYIWPFERVVLWQEPEPADRRLYEETFRIGNWLNDSNYTKLGREIRDRLGAKKP